MLKKYSIIIGVFGLLQALTANAEVTTAMYQKNPEVYKIYVDGLGTGYTWANTLLNAEKRKMLFCQPGSLALEAENYVRILNDGIKTADTGYIELTLINQLIRTFPCK